MLCPYRPSVEFSTPFVLRAPLCYFTLIVASLPVAADL